MKQVNRAVPKKDAMALLTGKPVYTQDIADKDALVVKILRSPHAHAEIVPRHLTHSAHQAGTEGSAQVTGHSQQREERRAAHGHPGREANGKP